VLILTRRLGESITISDEIKIKVLRIKGYQISISIDVPKEIPIWREEIWKNIIAEREGRGMGDE
jgi:carbon storage regulator